MNVTLSLDDELVKKVRKIAVDHDTTLTGMIREYLEKVAEGEYAAAAERKRQQIEKLKESFEKFSFPLGKRTWARAELHERPRRAGSDERP
jgi:hypothetical protein